MKNDHLIRPGFDRRMTREEINRCPVARWEGPVEVVRSEKQLNRAAEELGRERVLGFDTETRPAFKKGQKYSPALVQLAGEKRVYLFQLRHCGFREPLAALLADPAIIKAGVSPAYDLKELRALAPFNAAGFTELADLAGQKGIKNNGLRGLAAVVLGLRITKSAQTTNWARKELTESQIRYAATDAWMGRELYFRLLELPDKRQ